MRNEFRQCRGLLNSPQLKRAMTIREAIRKRRGKTPQEWNFDRDLVTYFLT